MVKSDETLFSIVETVNDLDGAGITELAENLDLDLAKSAIHKHLKTLEHHGYVTKRDQVYHLSFKFLVLGGRVRNANKLSRLMEPKVREIADELGVVSTFAVEEHGRGVVVHQTNELTIDIRSYIGTESHLHQTAHGKAMLARLPDERIQEIVDQTGLPKSTEQTIDSPELLFEEVETIRSRGVAISLEESAEGEASVGVPIEDPNSGTLGAISITCPATNNARSRLENRFAERLFETVSEIRYLLSGE